MPNLKALLLIILLFTLNFAIGVKPITEATLAEFFNEQFAQSNLDTKQIASAVISVVYKNQTAFKAGYGTTSYSGQKIPPNPDTSIYCIASVTKTFLGLLTLIEVENGKLSINDNINDILKATSSKVHEKTKELVIVGNYENFAGLPVLPTTKEIQVKNLLSHTAGFDEVQIGIVAPTQSDMIPLEEFLHRALPPRIREPNIVSTYSNIGVCLLGHILEKITGKEINVLLKQGVLDKINMPNTFYQYPNIPATKTNNFVQPVAYSYPTKTFNLPPFEFVRYHNFGPAGSMFSTVTDLANYMNMALNYGSFFNNATGATHPVVSYAGGRKLFEPLFKNQNVSDTRGIGYIWVEEKYRNVTIHSHGGNIVYHHSKVSLLHDYGIGISMIINSADNNGAFFDKVVRDFIDRFIEDRTCNGPGERIINGDCFETFSPEKYPLLSQAEKRVSFYEGCYVNSRFEHTSWLSISGYLAPLCIEASAQSKGRMGVGATVLFVEVKPGQFRLAVRSGSDFLINKASENYVFEPNPQAPVSYLTIGALGVLERTRDPNTLVWVITLLLYLLYGVVFFFFSVVFLVIMIFENIKITNLIKSKQDTFELPLVDEEYENDSSEISTAQLTRKRKTTIGKTYIPTGTRIIFSTKLLSGLTVVAIIVQNIAFMCNNFGIYAVALNLILINPTKLYTQNSPAFSFFMSLPVVAAVIDLFLLFFVLQMMVHRTFLIKYFSKNYVFNTIGVLYTILFVASVGINLAVIISLLKFHWFGPFWIKL